MSARALEFRFGDAGFSCAIQKVDRTRLYGSVEVEARDDQGRRCELATLADDGQTLLPPGGVALAYLSPDGQWRDKSRLRPVDPDGQPVPTAVSTFKVVTDLERRVTVDDYLAHNIRLAYQLDPAGDAPLPEALLAELRSGAIFAFPFSYRGGLDADTGFLLADPSGEPWLTVGRPAPLTFVGFEEPEGLDSAEDEAPVEEETDLEFGF